MARHPTIKDETIIEAAREVFLARGFQATTAEVAERAGISEGSIFNRFKSKVDLFRAAIRSQLDDPAWVAKLPDRVGRSEMPEAMIELGLEIIAFFRITTPLLMMSWSNPGPDRISCHMGPHAEPPPLRAVRRLARYFDAEMHAGRIRHADPDALARAFVGGLHTIVFHEILLAMHDQGPLPADTFVREHVNLLWTGIAPRP